MKRLSFLIISVMWAPLLKTDSLPKAISCYQTGANSKNINAYISCFAENTEILDVTRFNNSHIEVSFYTHFGVKPGMIWMHMLIILKSSSIKTVAPPYAAEYVQDSGATVLNILNLEQFQKIPTCSSEICSIIAGQAMISGRTLTLQNFMHDFITTYVISKPIFL